MDEKLKFTEQSIRGVFIIEPDLFVDHRGTFRRHFCENEFREHDIDFCVRQCNVSENIRKGTLRGFHYQIYPYGEAKIISCFKGGVYDILVDLRPESETYLKWISFDLSEENRKSLYLPHGCANAWLTLKENTWMYYHHSEFFNPGAEKGIRYNDPFFKFKWPTTPEVISEKDSIYPDFNPSAGSYSKGNK
ncbi:dTDP-4-dehydrorhamnose 3,5-epimerase family protein [bacterium]|nr:dTDP-4-keto-6-deoxy-D-glucose epimerase [Candidatus Omnitrophota bacterium]MBU3929160.1 dTDP-4-dehydrorhamnose 3,5-epimerase family protein [bacterium]MBU4122438.1 dTDP-4-dehydrorhamnose 3,5-epimerase family protein [bacterium]